ncbi:MAG: GNAT family N-acetyltransferase [Bacteroidia bacterium]|nr:GNAT family N-acetyltransferase [Bacteroidia bacterium]
MEIDKLQFNPVSRTDDISKLAHMAKEIWEEHYTPIIGKDQVNYMVEKFQSESAIIQQIKDDYSYFIITRNKQPIGYLCFIKKNKINSLFLSKIYLKKPFRRMGCGRKMIQFVIQQASKLKCQSITLTVNKYNKNTILAYQKLGFIQKRELVIDIGNGFVMDDFEMSYDLNSNSTTFST